MNPDKLFLPVFVFPFCALAARYKQDSQDGDKDPFDCIEDMILSEWMPGARITRYYDASRLDFAYAVEDKKRENILIVKLGTEGTITGPGWVDDFSPGIGTCEYHQLGGHVGFLSAGVRMYHFFSDLIRPYGDRVIFTGQSRGGPVSESAAMQHYRISGAVSKVVGYCGPPTWVPAAADAYDKCLGGSTISIDLEHDLVDDIAWPIFRHVGNRIHLTYDRPAGEKRIPIEDGHRYSSILMGLRRYCSDRKMTAEVDYLDSKKWVCTV
jgi:hypothetical protein